MTTQGPGQTPPSSDPWHAALGEVNDPLDQKFEGVYLPGRPDRHWPRIVRNILVTLLVLGAVGGGVYALVGKSSKSPTDAGSPIGTGSVIVPSTTTHSPVALATTAAGNAIQLSQALTANTNWGQLAPFLTNLSTSGVPKTCLNVSSSNVTKCRFGAKPASHHAVLIGDAAALDWMPALVAALQPHGWDVQVLTEANCPVSHVAITINNVVDSACTDHHHFVTDELAAIKPTLIVTSDQAIDLEYATAPPKPKGKPRETSKDAFTHGMTSAVENFASYGKVVVIGPPPGTKRIADCRAGTSAPKSCAGSVGSGWQEYQRVERAALQGHATYIDPTPYFCHEGKCPAIVGVTPTYVDGVRVTDAYSKSLAFVFAAYAKA